MAKRFSCEENYAIFNTVVYEGLEKHDWRKLYKDCRGASLNKKKINTLNELVEKCREYECLNERTDSSIAIQISLCVCLVVAPDIPWIANHSRKPIYEKLYKEIGLL